MPRGRKPKPTALKILEGNPGKRALNKREPKPTPEMPTPPEHLDAIARVEWDRMAVELHHLGLLTGLDRAVLAGYCDAYSLWVRATQEMHAMLAEPGSSLVIVTEKGYQLPHPLVAIRNKARDAMLKFGVEFGLSPSSRSRVSVPNMADEDLFEKEFGS